MEKLADAIATFFEQKNWSSPELHTWVVYSLEKRMLFMISILCFLGIMSLLAGFHNALTFFIILNMFRSCCNGWHASRPWICVITSLLLTVVFGVARPIIVLIPTAIILIFIGIFLIFLILFAPVKSPTLELTKSEHQALRKQIIFRAFLTCLITIFLVTIQSIYTQQMLRYLFLSLGTTAIGVLAALCCYRHKPKEE